MKERQLRQGETLRQLAKTVAPIDFKDARANHLKEELLAHNDRVTTLTAENRRAKIEEHVQHRGKSLTKEAFRAKQLLPLSRRGRRLARVHPELISALKVPHKNASITEIVDAAERIADALTPHLHTLIEAKYSRNCLEELRADGRTLRAHAEAVEASKGLLNQSNRALTEELAMARETINELDAVLRTLDNYPSFRTKWERAKHVGARMGRPTKRRLAARKRSANRRLRDS